MPQSKAIINIFKWIQLLNWTIVSILIVYYIFILNSPNWLTTLEIGFTIQLCLVIILFILNQTRFLFKWILFDTFPILMLGLMELGNSGRIQIFSGEDANQLGILIIVLMNLLFGISIAFILKYLKKVRLK